MSKELSKDNQHILEHDLHIIVHGITAMEKRHKEFIEKDSANHKEYLDFVTRESTRVLLAEQNIRDLLEKNNTGIIKRTE